MDVECRQAEAWHLEAALAINEAVVPAVNSLATGQMAWFLDNAPWFRVALGDGEILGILIGFFEGATYASENYRWFSNRYERFAYVDRVAVSRDARRRGIATLLYRDFIANLPAGTPFLTCEVNTRPPNPDSIRFHERFGFEKVGSQETENGEKEVALLAKPLTAVS